MNNIGIKLINIGIALLLIGGIWTAVANNNYLHTAAAVGVAVANFILFNT